MSKIKTLLQLVENIDDMSVDDGDGRVDVWQSHELTKAIREAKLEHEQLVACINRFSPSAFRDITVFNELRKLI